MPSRFAFHREPRRRRQGAAPSAATPQASLWDRIATPTTRAQATPASHQAAARAERSSSRIARAALRAFARPGAQLTADECAAAIDTKWIRVRPRVSNLLWAGLLQLVDPPKQRPSANGAPADVLEITPAGRKVLDGNRPIPRPPRTSRSHAA